MMRAFVLIKLAVIFVAFSAYAKAEGVASQIYVQAGSTKIISLQHPIGRFVVGNAEIIEVMPIDILSFYILGKTNGLTSLQVFDSDKVTLLEEYNIQSGPNLDILRGAIERVAPDLDIELHFENASLQVFGKVPDESTRDLILSLAEGVTGVMPIDAMVVNKPQQVQLKVRFLEVSRSLDGDLGVGFIASGSALGKLSIIDSAINIDFVLKALEEQGYAKFLAEPTLTALSGQEASFLAGGEVPIVTTDGDGKSRTEYKPYGIQLFFKPSVDKNGTITLFLSPEVSQLDFKNSVNGLPTITTRRATTTVEMKNRQSLVLAGLYQNIDTRSKSEVPALAELPIIGSLFRNSSSSEQETEVMIVITPSLSFVTTQEELEGVAGLEESRAAEPTQFMIDGILENRGYSLSDLLKGIELTGPFGPMMHQSGVGVFKGAN